jgi:hypothetical protein
MSDEAVSFTCSTTRLITLRAPFAAVAATVAPAAAPAAAATTVLRRRVAAALRPAVERDFDDELFADARPFDDELLDAVRLLAPARALLERFAAAFFPPRERFAEVIARFALPARFFEDVFEDVFEDFFDDFLLLERLDDLEDLLLDEDFLLEEPLREPPRPDDFFEEPFFDAAMGMSPFQSVGWGAVTRVQRSRCACNLVAKLHEKQCRRT